MNNNELCIKVYETINIKGICYKLGINRNVEDIEQIVYEIILNLSVEKNNSIVENGALLSFVYMIVRNQITKNPKSEWLMLKNTDEITENLQIIEDEYDWLKEDKLQFIEREFSTKRRNKIEYLNQEEQEYEINKIIIKNKITKKWSLTEMKDRLQISRNTLNNCIQNGKKEVLKRYERRSKE